MHHHITARLNKLLQDNDTSATELALGAGISNATISKIRKHDYSGSVSFDVIQKICHYFDVPLEYFSKERAGTNTAVGMKFHDWAHGSGAQVYKDFMLKCLGQETVYISNTIPDALKTAAILRAELGSVDSIAEYGETMQSIRNDVGILKNLSGTFFINKSIMNDLVNRQGLYKDLTPAEVIEQVGIIYNLFHQVFPRVHGYVVDYAKNDLNTCFLINKKYGANFYFGGYLTWESDFLGNIINEKAIKAINDAVSVSSFINEHIPHLFSGFVGAAAVG